MSIRSAFTLLLFVVALQGAHGEEESRRCSSLEQAILKPGTGEYDFPTIECDLQWCELREDGRLIAIPQKAAPMASRMQLNRVRNYGCGTSVYFHNADVFGRYSLVHIPRLPDLSIVGKLKDTDDALKLLGTSCVRWRDDWVWGYLVANENGGFSVMIVRIRFNNEALPLTKWIATAEISGNANQ